MKKIFLLTMILWPWLIGLGQTFTLQQCIDTAIHNNIDVTNSLYNMQTVEVNKQQAFFNMFPSVSGNIGHSQNRGRSIDPATNVYATQKFSSGNYNLSGDVILFQGFTLQNLMKQGKINFEAAKMDLQQQKDNITLNVILAYLQILNNKALIAQAEAQQNITQKQVERLTIMDTAGAIAPNELFDVKAQRSNDMISLVTAKQSLQTSIVEICRLMNIVYNKEMQFVDINIESSLTLPLNTPNDAYNLAMENFASIKSSHLQLESAAQGVKVAKGFLMPTLSLGGGVYSNYSSTNPQKYTSQVQNNISTGVGLSLGIPIFNSLRARNNKKIAEIALKKQKAVTQNAELGLQLNVEQAYVNVTAGFENMGLSQDRVTALENSFKAAEAKFNAGVGNSVDYLTVKNNLDNANTNLINQKFNYLLRLKIYEFYQGKTSVE